MHHDSTHGQVTEALLEALKANLPGKPLAGKPTRDWPTRLSAAALLIALAPPRIHGLPCASLKAHERHMFVQEGCTIHCPGVEESFVREHTHEHTLLCPNPMKHPDHELAASDGDHCIIRCPGNPS
jgi:hypothetical protein